MGVGVEVYDEFEQAPVDTEPPELVEENRVRFLVLGKQLRHHLADRQNHYHCARYFLRKTASTLYELHPQSSQRALRARFRAVGEKIFLCSSTPIEYS